MLTRPRRLHLKQSLITILKKQKLEHHRAAIERALLPAVRITTTAAKRNLKPGVSKFGGLPGLHKSGRWPTQDNRPLHFLGQIRLSDASRHLPRGQFPAKGWIRLWYDTLGERRRAERTFIDGTKFEPSLLRLTFDPNEKRVVETRPFPNHSEKFKHESGYPWRPLPPASLRFSPFRCIDSRAYDAIYTAEWEKDRDHAWDRCSALLAAIEGVHRKGDHRLLGDAHDLQSDPRFAAACMAARVCEFGSRSKALEKKLRAQAKRYRLLLCLDSDRKPDFEWGDMGSLQWWIREDHLAKGALEKAVGLYEQGG